MVQTIRPVAICDPSRVAHERGRAEAGAPGIPETLEHVDRHGGHYDEQSDTTPVVPLNPGEALSDLTLAWHTAEPSLVVAADHNAHAEHHVLGRHSDEEQRLGGGHQCHRYRPNHQHCAEARGP